VDMRCPTNTLGKIVVNVCRVKPKGPSFMGTKASQSSRAECELECHKALP
jgi:hypothetical protein